jgi:hypothetical protein
MPSCMGDQIFFILTPSICVAPASCHADGAQNFEVSQEVFGKSVEFLR